MFKRGATIKILLVLMLLLELLFKPIEVVKAAEVSKEEYICKPFSPHIANGDEIVEKADTEYYLLKTEDEVFANLSVLYEDDDIISLAFGTNISRLIEESAVVDKEFALIAYEEEWYVYKEMETDAVACESQLVTDLSVANVNNLEPSENLNMTKLEEMRCMTLTQAYSVMPRSSYVLSVPHVSAEGKPVCWAAAASAKGKYHTGTLRYSAPQVSLMIKGGYVAGSMDDARACLSRFYDIETTKYTSEIGKSTIVSCINTQNPILLGLESSDKTMAHMVVICGFDDYQSTTTIPIKYYVRDSNYDTMQIVSGMSNGMIWVDYYAKDLFSNEYAY